MNGTMLVEGAGWVVLIWCVRWLIVTTRRAAQQERERERQQQQQDWLELRAAMWDAETLDARLRRWEQESYGVTIPTTQDGATDLT